LQGTAKLITPFWQMRQTITIRFSKELAACLEDTAAKTGVSQEKVVRDQLGSGDVARWLDRSRF
jgi:hypothetical protein